MDPAPRRAEPAETAPAVTVRRLLSLGLLGGIGRPVDDLIDRIREPDGRDWLEFALQSGPAGAGRSPEDLVLRGRGTRTELVRIKDESKVLYRASVDDRHSRLTGLLTYLLVLAALYVHHDVPLSARAEEELRAAWMDLALVAPDAWKLLLSEAALGLTRSRRVRPGRSLRTG